MKRLSKWSVRRLWVSVFQALFLFGGVLLVTWASYGHPDLRWSAFFTGLVMALNIVHELLAWRFPIGRVRGTRPFGAVDRSWLFWAVVMLILPCSGVACLGTGMWRWACLAGIALSIPLLYGLWTGRLTIPTR